MISLKSPLYSSVIVWRDITLGDLIHIFRCNVQRVYDVGDRVIYARYQLVPVRLRTDSASARLSSSPFAAAWTILSVSASRSFIILTMAFRLFLMMLYWPLYSVVMVGGMISLRDLFHIVRSDHQGIDDVGDRVIYAGDQLIPTAREQIGVRPFVQLAVCRRLDDLVRLRQQLVHHLDRCVQVVLDFIEIALVNIGYSWRDIALTDPVHVFGRHVQRSDHGIQGIVHPFHDLAIVSLVLRCIRAGGEPAFHCRLLQIVGVGYKGVHGIDTGVEVILDFVEVTFVLVGDFRWHVPLADPVHIFSGNVQRLDDVGDRVIDAGDQLVPTAHEQIGIRPLVEFAVCRRLDDLVGLGQQFVHHLDHGVQVVLDDVVLALVLGQ